MIYNERAYGGVDCKMWTFLPPGPINGHPRTVPLMILAHAKALWLKRHVYNNSVYGDVVYREGGELTSNKVPIEIGTVVTIEQPRVLVWGAA